MAFRFIVKRKVALIVLVGQFMILTALFRIFRGSYDADSDVLDSMQNGREPVDAVIKFSLRKTAALVNKNKTFTDYDNTDKFKSNEDRNKVFVDSLRTTEIDDVFISVKTTGKFHKTRVQLLLDTWVIMAREQTYFFTDTEDPEYQEKTNNHMINTGCSSKHSRRALCCKMGKELDYFLDLEKRWFCHVDDDTYLNVPQLIRVLQKYNHTGSWYLGKPSLQHPIQIIDKEDPKKLLSFWFATGGAGFCISRGLARKMIPFVRDGNFQLVGEKIRLPDDCTVGYIITHQLGKKLTTISTFHSHLEALWVIKKHNLNQQVTFSYSYPSGKGNILDVPLIFPDSEDQTRFKSAHCHLYPEMHECPVKIR